MPAKEPGLRENEPKAHPKPAPEALDPLAQPKDAAEGAQQAVQAAGSLTAGSLPAGSLTPRDVLRLQRTLGNQSVGRLLSGKKPRAPVVQRAEEEDELQTRRQPAGGEGFQIQRLMTTQDFQDRSTAPNDSSIFSKGRNKVRPVDRALDAFHRIEYKAGTAKVTALQAVIDACNTYLALPDASAKRKPGVQLLLQDATHEKPIIQEAARLFDLPNDLVKIRQAVILQDQIVRDMFLRPGDVLLMQLNGEITEVMLNIRGRLKPEDKKAVMQDDLDRLSAMQLDTRLPQVTRDALGEILANVGLIDFTTGGAGSGFRKNVASTDPKKYFVMNNPKKGDMGTGERLGALAHELTHVAVSEKFGNTKMMWSFAIGLDDTRIKALSTTREGYLTELIALINSIAGLGDQQKNRLREQLLYAKRPNLMADAAALTPAETAKFDRLKAAGVNWSTLVEFDTNINQCLVLMGCWGVPTTDPFYARLILVATEANAARQT